MPMSRWNSLIDRATCLPAGGVSDLLVREYMQRIGETGRFKEVERNIELVKADPIARHGFTQVPNFLFIESGLSMGAIVVYAKFLSYAWHNDYCFPGQQRLADDLGVSLRSVTTWINELESAGLLTVVQRGLGKTNLYQLAFKITRAKTK
jgi:hypothetical protein